MSMTVDDPAIALMDRLEATLAAAHESQRRWSSTDFVDEAHVMMERRHEARRSLAKHPDVMADLLDGLAAELAEVPGAEWACDRLGRFAGELRQAVRR